MKSSELPRSGSFLPRVPQEIIYELLRVAYIVDKIEKWQVANIRLMFLRAQKSPGNY